MDENKQMLMADLLRNAKGMGSAARAIAQPMLGDIPAGLSGLGTMMLTGDMDKAAANTRAVQEQFAYEPNERGGEYLGALGRGIESAKRAALRVPGAKRAAQGWEDFTVAAPGAAAITAGVLGAGVPEGRAEGAVARATEKAAAKAAAKTARQTVRAPERIAFPGVYERPDVIAAQAVQNVEPESPLLKRLFGVTRDDLYQMSLRKGNIPGSIPGAAAKPKGSAAAEKIMTPENAQRLQDVIGELRDRAPTMYQPMHAWYVMDPEYHRMVELLGPEKGKEMYLRLNNFGGIESPQTPVPVEFNRATAANWLAEQGRWGDWKRYGGLGEEERAVQAPADMQAIPGRLGHRNTTAAQENYLATGEHGMESPKAPLYIDASGVPETGFQTDTPVADAHFSRGVGLADTRTNKGFAASVSTPELQQIAPWWRDEVAGRMGIESVPGQAVIWGGFGPATGVKTKVGVPKLELHAVQIGKAAQRMGVSPETARDLILTGRAHAGKADPALLAAMAAGGGAAAAAPALVNALRQKSDE